ncbi:MAG: hypothetical protein ACI9W2_000786 [Gammaproteobacteria bacterium]|jgi:hypothetical protein
MARKEIFSQRRSCLLRKHVPVSENLVTTIVGLVLLTFVMWALSARDSYDASHRDLAPELLAGERPVTEIHNRALKLWVKSGRAPTGTVSTFDYVFYPPAFARDGWSFASRIRKSDASNLYEKINGEAEKSLGLGFVAMHYALLRAPADPADGVSANQTTTSAWDGAAGPAKIAMELFDQGTVAGSAGAFSIHRSSSRKVPQRAGVTCFLTSVGVVGRIGRFFFRAAGNVSTEAVRAKASRLVDDLSALASGGWSGEPRAVVPSSASIATAVLTKRQAPVVPPGMKFLMDAFGAGESAIRFKASNAFQLDFASDFWFAALPNTTPGASFGSDDSAEAFIHLGSSPEQSARLVEQLLVEQANEYEPLPKVGPSSIEEPRWTVLRHEFLGTYFGLGRDGRYVFGAHRVNERAQVDPILEKLARVARDEAKSSGPQSPVRER